MTDVAHFVSPLGVRYFVGFLTRPDITARTRESEPGPCRAGSCRRENESPRFDSDAFSALTVIGRVDRPDDDTGSLWHCDSPFAELRVPLSLSLSRCSLRERADEVHRDALWRGAPPRPLAHSEF